MNLIACMLQKRYFWFLLSHRFFLCWAFRWYMLYRNFWAASGMRSFCTISRFCAAESAATGPPSSARCTAIAHRTMRAGPTAAVRGRGRGAGNLPPHPHGAHPWRRGLTRRNLASSVSKIDTLQKGNQSRTAAPNGPVSPLGHPFDKISRKIAHSSLRSSHTIFREISLYVSLSSAQVRRRGRILIS